MYCLGKILGPDGLNMCPSKHGACSWRLEESHPWSVSEEPKQSGIAAFKSPLCIRVLSKKKLTYAYTQSQIRIKNHGPTQSYSQSFCVNKVRSRSPAWNERSPERDDAAFLALLPGTANWKNMQNRNSA